MVRLYVLSHKELMPSGLTWHMLVYCSDPCMTISCWCRRSCRGLVLCEVVPKWVLGVLMDDIVAEGMGQMRLVWHLSLRLPFLARTGAS